MNQLLCLKLGSEGGRKFISLSCKSHSSGFALWNFSQKQGERSSLLGSQCSSTSQAGQGRTGGVCTGCGDKAPLAAAVPHGMITGRPLARPLKFRE